MGGFSISRVLGALRFGWMPLGLCALAAVGIHAAADAVDDRVLLLVERADAWLDGLFSQAPRLAPWVDAVGSLERTRVARAVALAWELAVDAAIALPALAWKDPVDRTRGPSLRELLGRLNRQPTWSRFFRPLAALAFAGAGAWAVSRMLETALFSALGQGALPPGAAEPLARVAAAAALLLVGASLGVRLWARTLEHADALCLPGGRTARPRPLGGFLGTALALPLAVAAVLDATPLAALFR